MRWFLFLLAILILPGLAACTTISETSPAAEASPTAVSAAAQSVPTATQIPVSTATLTPTATPEPSPTPEPQSARFAVIGDLGSPGPISEEVANLVKGWEPDFIVTTGDNNFPNGAAETIDANIGQYYYAYIHPYVGTYGPGADSNRFFPILGNHDWDVPGATPYFDYFTLPGNERYYSVVREPVTIYALNSMPGEPDGIDSESAQAAWLRRELAGSTTCWNLVFFHHTAYTSGHRGPSEWMRWPYREWGADATLSGHNHIYERVMIDDFPYFTNGLGGAPRYAFADEIAEGSAVRYNADHGAMLVEAVDWQITFQFVTRLGEVIDTFTLEKDCP